MPATDDSHYNAAEESSSRSHKAAAAALVAVVVVELACCCSTSGCCASRQKIGVHPVSVRIFPFRVDLRSQCFEEAAAYCHCWSLHEICRYPFRKLV